MKRYFLIFITLLLVACSTESADSEQQVSEMQTQPAKIGLCVACHGVDGRSRMPGTPHLAGQDAQYLKKAMTDYRSGARKALPMNSIANSLQANEIEALSNWYAAQQSIGSLNE